MSVENKPTRARRKSREGIVVSDKMDKTIVVLLERKMRHPLFGKTIRTSSKLYAHDEKGDARMGYVVRISETRPLSKQKRWRLVEVLKKAQ